MFSKSLITLLVLGNAQNHFNYRYSSFHARAGVYHDLQSFVVCFATRNGRQIINFLVVNFCNQTI